MGLRHFSGGGAECSPPNPDPYRFRVIKQENRNGKSILLVKYEGCTTFNGEKLLLTRTIYKGKQQLDPHLLGNDHIVLARFEPTTEGWRLARLCADGGQWGRK